MATSTTTVRPRIYDDRERRFRTVRQADLEKTGLRRFYDDGGFLETNDATLAQQLAESMADLDVTVVQNDYTDRNGNDRVAFQLRVKTSLDASVLTDLISAL
ncbi:MAG: hypothetical protein AAGF99_00360 [Bacteroidota bacterium]